MTLILMSEKELNRASVLDQVTEKRLTKTQAAEALGISRRQVYRLYSAYQKDGHQALTSKKRGKPSNRRYPSAYRNAIIDVVRSEYEDFGPTLAAEKLAERHGIHLSVETLRQWMVTAGIWTTRAKRRERVYQPLYRRDCVGELVQIDGSNHHWFEDRGSKCTLLVYIDDATSRIQHMHFVKTESAFDYFRATQAYIMQYGKPVAFYSDKHSTFRVNAKGATGGTGMTQFGRALHDLNIEIICANSAQAKGRVERANKTLQDRLVKELRLEGISDMDAGNAFLPSYTESYNIRFAKEPKSEKDVHRPLSNHDDMDTAFSWQEKRTVSNSLSIQYDRVVFLIEPSKQTSKLRRKRVTVHDYPNGRLIIRHDGIELPYSVFDKVRQVKQAEVVSNKRLDAALAFAVEQQAVRSVERSKKAPKRQGQRSSQFVTG